MTPNILRTFSVPATPGHTTIEVPLSARILSATVEGTLIQLSARVPKEGVHLTGKRIVSVVEPWCDEPNGCPYLGSVVALTPYEDTSTTLLVYVPYMPVAPMPTPPVPMPPLKRTEPTAEEVLAELRKIDGEDGFLEPIVQWLNQGPRKQRTLGEVLVSLATHRARSALP